jgi:hypothetical protein
MAAEAPASGRRGIPLIGWAIILLGLAGIVLAIWNPGGQIVEHQATTRLELPETTERLELLVRRESLGLIVTNDTDVTWKYCTAVMTGGYTLTVPVLKARETLNFPYRKFSVGQTQLEEDQGFARAIRELEIACDGPDGRRQRANLH